VKGPAALSLSRVQLLCLWRCQKIDSSWSFRPFRARRMRFVPQIPLHDHKSMIGRTQRAASNNIVLRVRRDLLHASRPLASLLAAFADETLASPRLVHLRTHSGPNNDQGPPITVSHRSAATRLPVAIESPSRHVRFVFVSVDEMLSRLSLYHSLLKQEDRHEKDSIPMTALVSENRGINFC